jgi:hypothetical protein
MRRRFGKARTRFLSSFQRQENFYLIFFLKSAESNKKEKKVGTYTSTGSANGRGV